MKVYIVTAGTYSDYHIERVFSTKEKAQEYLDHIGNDDDVDIEEYNLDEETPRGVFGYSVTIYNSDNEATVCRIDFNNFPHKRKDAFRWIPAQFCLPDNIWFNIEAKDAPHAVKIASERLAQIRVMPYLFPLLKKECVYGSYKNKTPIYDFFTKEILLGKGERLELPQSQKGGLV